MRGPLESQRGGALIFVTMVGLVLTLLFAMFMGSTVVVEQRAIEAQLARSRVYWAEMGAFSYALSRISASSLCGANCGNGASDATRAATLQDYFNELSGNNLSWTYLNESASYSFTTSVTAAPDDTPGRNPRSGWLMATASYTPSTLLSTFVGKAPLMQLRLCVGLASDKYCKDQDVDKDNGGNTLPYFSINRLTNMPFL
jgi:Tfp pilus assembly protein PilX